MPTLQGDRCWPQFDNSTLFIMTEKTKRKSVFNRVKIHQNNQYVSRIGDKSIVYEIFVIDLDVFKNMCSGFLAKTIACSACKQVTQQGLNQFGALIIQSF